MRLHLRLLLVPLFLLSALTAFSAPDPVSEKIDHLIADGYTKNKIIPNAPASDEVLVRRLYLDIIGRIPTQDEVRAFTESPDPARRSALIDQLLASDGYVSHGYN